VDPRISNFRARYRAALRQYLAVPRDDGLELGAALGREALVGNIGLLDIVRTHFEATVALKRSRTFSDERPVIDAAAGFLLASLSPFQVLQARDRNSGNVPFRVTDVLDEERRRIAQLIHDQAGSLLATAYVELAAIAGWSADAEIERRVRRINGYLDDLRERLRQLSHELYPVVVEQPSLVPTLGALARRIAQRASLTASVRGVVAAKLSPTACTTIYGVVQEALVNAALHAHARRVIVRLWRVGREQHCLVRDDGHGFGAVFAGHGLGIIGMYERAKAVRGTLKIRSARGCGTSVKLTLPI
jgi:signal transduction histidine kinase